MKVNTRKLLHAALQPRALHHDLILVEFGAENRRWRTKKQLHCPILAQLLLTLEIGVLAGTAKVVLFRFE